VNKLQSLIESGLVDRGDGTIFDTRTNLLWQQGFSDESMTWQDAKKYCKHLILARYDDWRLPTKEELKSLVNKKYKPAIDPIFKCNPDWYWSSSSDVDYPSGAWSVGFCAGGVSNDGKYNGSFVRAVRKTLNE